MADDAAPLPSPAPDEEDGDDGDAELIDDADDDDDDDEGDKEASSLDNERALPDVDNGAVAGAEFSVKYFRDIEAKGGLRIAPLVVLFVVVVLRRVETAPFLGAIWPRLETDLSSPEELT